MKTFVIVIALANTAISLVCANALLSIRYDLLRIEKAVKEKP